MSHRCPHCRAGFEAKTAFFPFCSERCKLLDLGAWASERYSIPAHPAEENDSGDGLAEENSDSITADEPTTRRRS